MPTLVSTGQITIIDQNDAKPITAFIGGSTQTQQIHTKNNGVITHLPNWVSTPLTLTAYVYVGGTSNVAASLQNKKWSTTAGGTSIGSADTYVINTNLAEDAAPVTYYFEGDYYDTLTGLTTKVITSTVVSQVKTGSNAVYVQVRGRSVIDESNSSTPSVIAIGADLVRSSGYDTDNLTYKWYEGGGSTQISQAMGSGYYSGRYNLKSTTVGTNPTATYTELTAATALPTGTASTTNNTLILSQTAVTDLAIFKVEITDSVENQTYSTFFTVFDATDPYSLDMVSTAGTIFKNSIGTTEIYPRVYNGAVEIGGVDGTTVNTTPSQSADLRSWEFTYTFYDQNGKRAAFIDTTKTAVATGRAVTSSTAGAAGTFTVVYGGAVISFTAGDIVKLVKSNGIAEYYEVATTNSSTTTLALRYTPSVNTWLSWQTLPPLNDFQGGTLYACVDSQGRRIKTMPSTGLATVQTAIDARKISVTQYEIDGKGSIFCEASRPL